MLSLPVLSSSPPEPPSGAHPGPLAAAIARELAAAVEPGGGEVRFSHHDRMLYATDASLYQQEPLGIVIPATPGDAARAVAICAARGVAILPRGGGTSLAGQCTNHAIIIDFSPRCRAIRLVDLAQSRCEVEPGITIDDLNRDLAPTGLFFAPDPATSVQACIGGCIGNNAAGARSILFGRTSENLLGVEACLADGRRITLEEGAAGRDPLAAELTRRVCDVVWGHRELIRQRFPRTSRRNAGYNLDLILDQMESAGPGADAPAVWNAVNLAHLVCGSEGTLAVTLAAHLKLRRLPAAKGLALIGFSSLDEAIDLVAPILSTGPSAVELLDDMVLGLAAANLEYRDYIALMPAPADGPPRAVLYVEYFAGAASPAEELGGRFESLRRLIAREAPSARSAAYTDGPSIAAAWKLRRAGEPLLHGMPGERKPITFVEDNAVPVERLAEFVRGFRAIVARHGTDAAFWAHASVGVLHVRPRLDLRDGRDRRRMARIAVEVADLARSLGGVMSGEHGDGKVRTPLLERFYGPELMAAFRQVKAIFDPRNLLNPGNIVEPAPVESIAQRLRINPAGRELGVPDARTFFDYSDQHGFAGAVEMCNGAGVCRKTSGGTMCPSYMALLDERHSTRGRANALRLAITGQLSPDGRAPLWDDPGTLETLHLCLSCKACKAECPSNVDVARLKAEYTAQRFRRSGIPHRARLFANVRTLNRLGSALPGCANWLNRRRGVRAVLNRALGIAPRRSIPEFARPLRAGEFDGPDGGPRVALFADCFTMYNEPHIGRAAARLLRAFGYRVELIDAGCCGRAMISTGLLEDAARTIDRTLGRLLDAGRDRPLLVLEPSCLSAIKDDWLRLKLHTPPEARRRLAERSFMVEEFLEMAWDRHPAHPDFAGIAGPAPSAMLHAHCHQKALWGAGTSSRLLERILAPRAGRLRVLDGGCCGLAGSFGYDADRFELSMKIGELSLFPAVRGAGDAAVLSPGTSCRHQVKDGTGVRALHPVEFLAGLL